MSKPHQETQAELITAGHVFEAPGRVITTKQPAILTGFAHDELG